MSAPPARMHAMDGLRGWAAVSVAGYHFVWETFGARFPELRGPFVGAVLNGPLAVALFFVLSGYVLTARGWLDPDKSGVVRLLAKRYTRLAVPVLASCVIVIALMGLGLTANAEASRILGRADWLGTWLAFPPEPATMLGFAGLQVFFGASEPSYGPFLWTMTIELWGSVLVLGVCLLESRLRRPDLVLFGLGIVFLLASPLWSGFFFGALLALGHRRGWLPQGRDGTRTAIVAALAIVAMLAIAGLVLDAVDGIGSKYRARDTVGVLLAPALLAAICWSGVLVRLLSGPVSRALGRLSFPLYLVHFPVLVSLCSALVVAADATGRLDLWSGLGIAALSLAASLLAAVGFLPVERATALLGRWIESRLPRTGAVVARAPTAS